MTLRLYPNGLAAAYIMAEQDEKTLLLNRVVASPDRIREHVAHYEDTGLYDRVFVAQEVSL